MAKGYNFGDGPGGLFGDPKKLPEPKKSKKRLRRLIGLGGGPPAVDTRFVRDTFTDTDGTDVTSHTPEVGGVITEHPLDSAGNARITTNGGGTVYNSAAAVTTVKFMYAAVPPSPDYYVQAKYIMKTDPSPNVDSMGVLGRLDPAATTAYNIWWSGSSNRWELYKTVAGVDTLLAFSSVNVLSVANPRVIRLEMRTVGATVELTGYSDGAILFGGTIVDSAGNRITGAGRVGYRFYSPGATATSSTLLHCDNLEAGPL